LEWAQDDNRAAPPGADANETQVRGPSIFTAVREQLGHKLEPLAGAGDLYVIDRVERPSEN
jgi:uncharacterized protein (TIGR03435 family)